MLLRKKRFKFISLCLTLILCMSLSIPVYADPDPSSGDTTVTNDSGGGGGDGDTGDSGTTDTTGDTDDKGGTDTKKGNTDATNTTKSGGDGTIDRYSGYTFKDDIPKDLFYLTDPYTSVKDYYDENGWLPVTDTTTSYNYLIDNGTTFEANIKWHITKPENDDIIVTDSGTDSLSKNTLKEVTDTIKGYADKATASDETCVAVAKLNSSLADDSYIVILDNSLNALYKIKVSDLNNYAKEVSIDDETPFGITITNATINKTADGKGVESVVLSGKSVNGELDSVDTAMDTTISISDDKTTFTITIKDDESGTLHRDFTLIITALSTDSDFVKITYSVEGLTSIYEDDDEKKEEEQKDKEEVEKSENSQNETGNDLELSISGMPEAESVDKGEEVTLTLTCNKDAYLCGASYSSDKPTKSLDIVVTQNGLITYSATADNGAYKADSIYVNCFKEPENTYSKDDDDPWSGDSGETYLVQTGIFSSNRTVMLIAIWGTVISVLGLAGYVIYKRKEVK